MENVSNSQRFDADCKRSTKNPQDGELAKVVCSQMSCRERTRSKRYIVFFWQSIGVLVGIFLAVLVFFAFDYELQLYAEFQEVLPSGLCDIEFVESMNREFYIAATNDNSSEVSICRLVLNLLLLLLMKTELGVQIAC